MATNTQYVVPKTVIGGIYSGDPETVNDGDPVALNLDERGRVNISCTPFNPPSTAEGQAVSFSATAGRSTAMTIGARHWLWASEGCWIEFGDNSVTAAAGNFPLPPGAVVEYTPTTDRDYVSAVQINQTGTLYIGRAA